VEDPPSERSTEVVPDRRWHVSSAVAPVCLGAHPICSGSPPGLECSEGGRDRRGPAQAGGEHASRAGVGHPHRDARSLTPGDGPIRCAGSRRRSDYPHGADQARLAGETAQHMLLEGGPRSTGPHGARARGTRARTRRACRTVTRPTRPATAGAAVTAPNLHCVIAARVPCAAGAFAVDGERWSQRRQSAHRVAAGLDAESYGA
jgi:hypothetical protein